MKPLTIGQLAQRAGVGVETVRFYERRGLIDQPARKSSGYRQYGEEVVQRLRFIRRAKELGFTLAEIGELLSIRLEPTSTCGDVKGRAEIKIADIEGKIQTLRRMKQALVQVTRECKGQGTMTNCPILDALDGEERA